MARPRIDLTDEQVELLERLAACGLTQQEITDFLPLSERTLRNRLADEDDAVAAAYARGRAVWKEQISQRHRDICMGKVDDTPVSEQRKAIEFRLKTEFGYHEKMAHEHSGPAGAPIPIREIVIDRQGPEGDDGDG